MKLAVTLLLVASQVCAVGCAHRPSKHLPVGHLSFSVTAPGGLPRGSAVLAVDDPIRAYCARKTCLQPLLSKWAVIRFEGPSLPGEAYLRTRSLEEWPHPSDVRDFKTGAELQLDFEMIPGSRFYLRTDGGEEIPRLPSGTYRSTACLDVDTWPEIAHLGLTEFQVCSETVEFVVE